MAHRIEARTVYPSTEAQERYPLAKFPCRRCAGSMGLPYLIDHSSEFYWVHSGSRGGRDGCPRFGKWTGLGAPPREGTAVATYNLQALAQQDDS